MKYIKNIPYVICILTFIWPLQLLIFYSIIGLLLFKDIKKHLLIYYSDKEKVKDSFIFPYSWILMTAVFYLMGGISNNYLFQALNIGYANAFYNYLDVKTSKNI
ncbi:MAG: hypothetical protein ACOX1L_05160 [Erysipelotrichaceae bacterium]|jgi:hypothetical protein